MKMEFDDIRELNAAELDEVSGGIKIKVGNLEVDALEEELIYIQAPVPSLPGF